MKTTGYMLREAIKQQELRRDSAARSFDGTLRKFPDEVKEAPQTVVQRFLQAEKALAQLQVAQKRYNLDVKVTVLKEEMSLEEAVKLVGGNARVEKMWRQVAGPKRDRYASHLNNEEVREKDQIRSTPTITPIEATKLAAAAAKRAGAFRAAIAVANAREVELTGLDPALFE